MTEAQPPQLGRERSRRVVPAWVLVLAFAVSVGAIGLAAFASFQRRNEAKAEAPERASVYFAPGDQPTSALVKELNAAKSKVEVQAYSFTSAPIAKALVEAKRRGVDVTAILDKSQRTAHYSSADFLAHEGVPTFIDAQHAIAHNKVMIIDGATVITGSFNFTKAAEESNAENLLVIHDPKLAQKYEANWQEHLEHSEPYAGR